MFINSCQVLALGAFDSHPFHKGCIRVQMLPEKTKHSIFLPELVLGTLLSDNFPQWKKDIQLESIRWVVNAMTQVFKSRTLAVCFVNSDNQLLYNAEVKDSKHITVWACGLLKSATKAALSNDFHFLEVCIPTLRNLAFRDAEEELLQFLRDLRSEFDLILTKMCMNPVWFKNEAVQVLNKFETDKLPRHARCTSARVLGRHNILFGGMVYASAFSLAFIRLLWMDKKTEVLLNIGVIPNFRGSVPMLLAPRACSSRPNSPTPPS